MNELMKQYDHGPTESFQSIVSQSEMNTRVINVNKENTMRWKCCRCCCWRTGKTFKDNRVTTSRYNFVTFLPLNLLLQFSKMSNMYFLLLTIMEMIPPISDSNGVPVLILPLSFVVGVSMIKDIYEDFQRHRSDNEENSRKVTIAKPQKNIIHNVVELVTNESVQS